MPATDKAFTGFQRAIIGHNRFGTTGGISKRTAHPFDFDSLVGVHNGTLTTKWKLENGNEFKVDSEALFNHMEVHGLSHLMQHMGGAWALVWWDKAEETLNFLRNKERPLWIAFTNDNDTLFWASELWMLEGVLRRNGVGYKEPFSLGQDVHLSLAIDDKGSISGIKSNPMPSTYVPFVATHPYVAGGYHKPALTLTPEVKKLGVVPSQPSYLKDCYASSVDVVLEVLSLVDRDDYGSAYLACYDHLTPHASIRWYFNRSVDPMEAIGQEIVADIGGKVERGSDATYYKVSASSVKFVEVSVGIEEEEVLYEDFRGKMLSYNDWTAKHGECAWCGQVILPTDKHAMSSSGQTFCDCCMDNKDVKYTVSLTKFVEKAI